MDKKQSLYDIKEEFLYIFNQIEENDGELTPELEEALSLNRENYNTKGEQYCKVIKQYENYIKEIKEEKARLDNRKKVFENRIEKLKQILLNAIIEFGPIETFLFKISTRKSTTCEINENRIHLLNNAVINFAKDMYKHSVINFGEEVDLEGMIAAINANIKADYESIGRDDFKPFTVDDLNIIKVNINSDSNLSELFINNKGLLKALLENEQNFNIDNNTSKSETKKELDIYTNTTVAENINNVSLSIK